MKKLISLCLVFTMFFLFSIQPISASKNKVSHNENSIVMTILEKNDNYRKMKVEDKNKQTVEYLEAYLQEDGSYIYKATTQDDTYTIEKRNSEILVTNSNNEITQQIPLGNLDDIPNKEIDILYKKQNSIEPKLPSYCIPNSLWRETHNKGYTSRHIELGNASILIGIIAYITGLPESASLVASIVSWLITKGVPEVYYYYEEQNRIWDGWLEKRQYTAIYENSSYDRIVKSTMSRPYRYKYVGTPCK